MHALALDYIPPLLMHDRNDKSIRGFLDSNNDHSLTYISVLRLRRRTNHTKMSTTTSFSPTILQRGPIYFIGIGGRGMSGIAEIALRGGYAVSGSDTASLESVKRLESLGAKIFASHKAEQVKGASAVVHSTAIKADNPEMIEARAKGIPILHRADMLAELMRLRFSIGVGGTQGKTTTTSLVSALLDAGGLDPTVISGGVINAYRSSSKIGKGEWMVVETDESDGSFLRLRPSIAVLTNVGTEHLAHHGSPAALEKAFGEFIRNVPFYGFAVVCLEDPAVREIASHVPDRRLISYGTGLEANVRGSNISMGADGACFDVQITAEDGHLITWKRLRLPITGQHNVLNSLAAITIAWKLGVTGNGIRQGLEGFGGVKRRFTTIGTGRGVRVIDDNAHNPVQISATLSAARDVQSGTCGKVVAVFQPFRYTRLRDSLQGLCSSLMVADAVIVTEISPWGELPIAGVDKHTLVDALRRFGHRDALASPTPSDLAMLIAERTQPGDLVVCLGTPEISPGDVSTWACELPGQLEKIA
jgi:UDP-N-acetylmuramate--alanine ligase